MNDLRITFAPDAYDSWFAAVDRFAGYFVSVLPVGGGAPFNAYIEGVDDHSDDPRSIKIRRADEEHRAVGGVESVRVEKIHVF